MQIAVQRLPTIVTFHNVSTLKDLLVPSFFFVLLSRSLLLIFRGCKFVVFLLPACERPFSDRLAHSSTFKQVFPFLSIRYSTHQVCYHVPLSNQQQHSFETIQLA